MLSKALEWAQILLTPYTLEDFMRDANPQDHKDLKRLEAIWYSYQNRRTFNSCY